MPATLDNFYKGTAYSESATLLKDGRTYGSTTVLRGPCRPCERTRQAARRHGEDGSLIAEYPRTMWCPSGHGSHVFTDATAERLMDGRCPACPAHLVDYDPSKRPQVTKLRDLPKLPTPHHARLPQVVSALQAGRHVYLAGTPGTGKSELARQAAETLSVGFYMIACDSSMTRSALMGLIDAGGTYHRTALRDALEFGGVYLLDEIDNGNPSLLAALNSAMSNGKVAFPDATVDVHADFRVVATANTWGNGPTAEFVGRLKVDPATLDRFVRVYVGIDESLERELTIAAAEGDENVGLAVLEEVRKIRARVEAEGVKIIVSPRASMQVAALAARGWSVKDAIMTTAVGTLETRRANDLMGLSR
jgi:MoxR-like ATPase